MVDTKLIDTYDAVAHKFSQQGILEEYERLEASYDDYKKNTGDSDFWLPFCLSVISLEPINLLKAL